MAYQTFFSVFKCFSSRLAEDFRFRDHSYVISPPFWANVTVAEEICARLGGYLAEIEDQQENDFIVEFLRQKNAFADVKWILIGARDENSDDTFRYIHSGLPVTYFNWSRGEPSGGSHDCVGIGHVSLKMYDLLCVHHTAIDRALCEIDSPLVG